jgi:hypothetical protein
VRFAGFTPTARTGNMGGRVGAHAACDSAFPGSVMCTEDEYMGSTSGTPVPANGAWVDNFDPAYPGRRGASYTCNGWTWSGTASPEGYIVQTTGNIGTSYSGGNYGCEVSRRVACCFPAQRRSFRGFTMTSYTGNLGGRVGAHAACAAAFPGAHFCHQDEYMASGSPLAVPASGAWLDNFTSNYPGQRGASYSCSGWTWSGTGSPEGYIVQTTGNIGTSYSGGNYGCEVARPLACCD